MAKQIIFLATLLITLGAFGYTTRRYVQFFKITRGGFPVKQIGRRFGMMMEVAIGQTKIFRRPVLGLLHSLVFWGFLVIIIGSIDPCFSCTERLETVDVRSGEIKVYSKQEIYELARKKFNG